MMNKEEIIRDEAKSFGERIIEVYSVAYHGHIEFIELAKKAVNRFYNPEDKRVFIDQVIQEAQKQAHSHRSECTEDNCEIDKTYQKMLFFLDQEFNALPKIMHTNPSSLASGRTNIFISYSHSDKNYLDELKRHYKPIEKFADFWDDSRIKPGTIWKNEIKKSIENANVAILLISADFFNSEFIEKNELPPLLNAAQKDGLTILTVILSPCMFEEYHEINQYQAINNPSLPLSDMSKSDRERIWVDLVRFVRDISKN